MQTLQEVRHEIRRLKTIEQELELKERSKFLVEAQQYVGRCFRQGQMYAKVLDVPQEQYAVTGNLFQSHLYPALWIKDDYIPFELGHIHDNAWNKGTADAITNEEFEQRFQEALENFRARAQATEPLENFFGEKVHYLWTKTRYEYLERDEE
jgi:hypothetical protein